MQKLHEGDVLYLRAFARKGGEGDEERMDAQIMVVSRIMSYEG